MHGKSISDQKAILLLVSATEYQLFQSELMAYKNVSFTKVSHKEHLIIGKSKVLRQDIHPSIFVLLSRVGSWGQQPN